MPVSLRGLNEYILLPIAGNCAVVPILQAGLRQFAPQLGLKPIAIATGFIAQRLFDDLYCHYCPQFSDATRLKYHHLTHASDFLMQTMRAVGRSLVGVFAYQALARQYPKTPLPMAIHYLALPVSTMSYLYMKECSFSVGAIKQELATLAAGSYDGLIDIIRK